jgi:hypothetical protein
MERPRNTRDDDDTLLFKSMLPMKTMVGVGLLLGAIPGMKAGSASSWIPFCAGAAMVFVGTLSNVFKTLITGKSSDPMAQEVRRGRKTAIIEGDFVVFLIGARPNKFVDGFFKWMGDAMEEMLIEQEENPEIGCLGSESFVGPTGTMLVQYWKSMDQLQKYARRSSNKHSSPWATMMAKGRESADYGFWHEAFEVKAGKYDAIYVNCPPLLLGNCRNVQLVQAEGTMKSAAGRLRKTDGEDYPTNIGVPDY